MVMIALIILVPLDFELVSGRPANEAGIRLIPMTGGTVLGSFIAGQLVTRTGRYRIFPIVGAIATTGLAARSRLYGLGKSALTDGLADRRARLVVRVPVVAGRSLGAERAASSPIPGSACRS